MSDELFRTLCCLGDFGLVNLEELHLFIRPSLGGGAPAAKGKRQRGFRYNAGSGVPAVEWYIKLFLGFHFADNLA